MKQTYQATSEAFFWLLTAMADWWTYEPPFSYRAWGSVLRDSHPWAHALRQVTGVVE